MSVGPIYRKNGSIRAFSTGHAIACVSVWLILMAIVWILVHISRSDMRMHRMWRDFQSKVHPRITQTVSTFLSRYPRVKNVCLTVMSWWKSIRLGIILGTNRWWKIFLILLAVWGVQFVLVPTIFAADLLSQYSEMSRWMASLNGTHVPYADGFNVVDVYPIAHYMWPDTATYLTNQHNVVLTFIYGGALNLSQNITGSIDLGLIFLSALQLLFAAFAASTAVNRYFTFAHSPRIYNPDLRYRETLSASAGWRAFILLFFAFNSQTLFTTTALTKSPLFAWAFLWWFGQWYEVFNRRNRTHIPASLVVGIAISTTIMLISAKYATYIIVVQIVLIFIADRKRWRAYLLSLVLPLIVFQAALTVAVNTGTIISGDSIESRGIQLQQIARVMRDDPMSVSPDVQNNLRPIFNLYAMGVNYSPNDADRVKSSGSDGKVETYKWETVTQEDMDNFNKAWLELGKTHPVEYLDAFLAKSYGYFDVNDQPYVPTSYYVDNPRMSTTRVLKYWLPFIRTIETNISDSLGHIPVVGWTFHGNFYVVCTLLLSCATIILRRWKDLLRYIPLLLLMGVMIMAPANNFERHMLPLAFVGWLMILHFSHEAKQAWSRSRISRVM